MFIILTYFIIYFVFDMIYYYSITNLIFERNNEKKQAVKITQEMMIQEMANVLSSTQLVGVKLWILIQVFYFFSFLFSSLLFSSPLLSFPLSSFSSIIPLSNPLHFFSCLLLFCRHPPISHVYAAERSHYSIPKLIRRKYPSFFLSSSLPASPLFSRLSSLYL